MRPAGPRRPPRPHPRRREVTSTSRHTQRRRLLSRSLSRPRPQHAAEPRPGPSTPRPKSPRGHAQAARPGHPHTHAPNAPEITAHAARPGRKNGTRHLPTAVSLPDGCRSRAQQLIDVSQLSVTLVPAPRPPPPYPRASRCTHPLHWPTRFPALEEAQSDAEVADQAPCYGYESSTWKRYCTSTRPASREMPSPCSEQGAGMAESLVRLSRPA